MTELKDAFDWLAGQTPRLDDQLAERAIHRGRRRRRTRVFMLPAVGAATFALAIGGYITVDRQLANEPVLGNPPPASGTWLVDLPADVPKPLPSEPVGPVDMAYRVVCDGLAQPEDDKEPCRHWRLWNADGSTWRVPNVHVDEGRGLQDAGGDDLRLSPDGTMIAYARAGDESVVVRDLTTGKSRVVADDGVLRPKGWSHNSRWLVLDTMHTVGVSNPKHEPHSELVDTRTWRTTPLEEDGAVLGVPDKGEPIPAIPTREEGKVELWNRDGSVASELEPRWETWDGVISPDGKWLVESYDSIFLHDLDEGTREKLRFDEIEGTLDAGAGLGWYNDHTLFAVPTNDRDKRNLVYALNLETEKARTLIRFVGAIPYGPGEFFHLAGARLADAQR